jgi:heat shock protein HslJ
MDGETLSLNYNYGAGSVSVPEPASVAVADGMQWTAEGGALVVTALNRLCADNMTGMPYPATVTVDYDGQTFRGCGGSPKSLLEGDWAIVSINGKAVMANTPATLTFDGNADQMGGNVGCNAFGAGYTLTGETLTFGPVISTQMACADPLMAQERAALDALQEASAFSIGEDGALTLTGAGGTLMARR